MNTYINMFISRIDMLQWILLTDLAILSVSDDVPLVYSSVHVLFFPRCLKCISFYKKSCDKPFLFDNGAACVFKKANENVSTPKIAVENYA